MPESVKEKGKRQLQEVYFHLEHCDHGNMFIAWYGQLRAEEVPHAEALEQTIVQWNLRNHDWYQSRLKHKAEKDAKLAKMMARRSKN